MDKNEALTRLTFCGECGYWRTRVDIPGLKEEYRDYVGICNKPCEAPLMRCRDDFCSRGRNRRD